MVLHAETDCAGLTPPPPFRAVCVLLIPVVFLCKPKNCDQNIFLWKTKFTPVLQATFKIIIRLAFVFRTASRI